MDLHVFGKKPSGAILERIAQSPNFRSGVFQNMSETPTLSKDTSYFKVLIDFFNKPATVKPSQPLPAIQSTLTDIQAPSIYWFGHSSYLISINGFNILVDPVFSGNASPFTTSVKSFPGTDVYDVSHMPSIDLLIITHDHYDHLDYKTVTSLIPKVKRVCTSLGVGSHLAYWGYEEAVIKEMDWWERHAIQEEVTLTAAPARHFSGRLLKRGRTLWSSFILEAFGYRLYLGGDSGYDDHFKKIGKEAGPFNIALLECGQYNTAWPNIHMMPEETIQASIDLQAEILMPVHWGKFALGYHAWDEPIKRATSAALQTGVQMTTPRIGEPVLLGVSYPKDAWWEI